MHTIDFLTEKTNRHTKFYCVFAVIVSAGFLFAGMQSIIRSGGVDGLDIASVVIGIVCGPLAIWNIWAMTHEVVGLEGTEGSLNLLRPSGQIQRNVQLSRRLFTFGCIRFGTPNDAGRMDYSVFHTSVGRIAIPVELYNKFMMADGTKTNAI